MSDKKKTAAFLAATLFVIGSLYSEAARGFGGITLGMSVDAVKKVLAENPDFAYKGEEDVSLLPTEERKLIETVSQDDFGFLERCFFQFHEEKLYIMTICINRRRVDYFSVFQKLRAKYGEPENLYPDLVVWRSGGVKMTLERELTIKYTDEAVFQGLMKEAEIEKAGLEKTVEMFLDEL